MPLCSTRENRDRGDTGNTIDDETTGSLRSHGWSLSR